jgi:hypothetical protein
MQDLTYEILEPNYFSEIAQILELSEKQVETVLLFLSE